MSSENVPVIKDPIMKFLDPIAHKVEQKVWGYRLKKIFRKFKIPKDLANIYLDVNNKLFSQLNSDHERGKESPLHMVLYRDLVMSRLFQLYEEFLWVLKREHFHCVTALERQLVEIYIHSLYFRKHPHYKKILFERIDGKFPPKKQMIEELKKEGIKIDYITGISTSGFLDQVYKDFGFLSDLFHTSPRSLATGVWVVEKSIENVNTTRLYIDDPDTVEGKDIITFPRHHYVSQERVKWLFHNFMIYIKLVLNEIYIHVKTT